MRINYNTVIRGEKVVLVPYRKEHVDTYHSWMQDPALLESTASDPLTLEEEYCMQQSWMNDDDKCTFILLDPSRPESDATRGRGGGMVGDVNLFFNDPDDRHAAEIEVMVAEPAARRKGLAKEALIIFMLYGATKLGLKRVAAKIGFDNLASQRLFTGLGYKEHSRSQVFRETTFTLTIDEATQQWLQSQLPARLSYESYE